MPREHRKRGRREEQKKRKRENAEEPLEHKRHKQSFQEGEEFIPLRERQGEAYGYEDGGENEGGAYGEDAFANVERPGEMEFYGMLDEEEQEYFKRADQLLEANQFEGPEERDLFLENVYKEADGKELRIANSQSCSRLMERLILLSKPAQLKRLFQRFSGHFLNLVQHRFASHCCEALFVKAAPVVTEEIMHPDAQGEPSDPNEVYVSMENLFLYAINELEGYLGYLMTDRFASHTLRVLLVVLSGLPLEQKDRTVLQSKRKEKISVLGVEKATELTLEQRKVPDSFTEALGKIIQNSVAGLDTNYLRALALHPTGNPTLQLLLQVELSKFGKQKAKDENSIMRRLLPDDPITENSESASFINGLIYSPVGSRLLETIIEFSPGKTFKALYKQFFKERMGSLARNEIAGYVASKVLQRLSKEDLDSVIPQIMSQMGNLMERNRTAVIKVLIERCAVRGADTKPIAQALESALQGPNGFDIARLLKLGEASTNGTGEPEQAAGGQQARPDKLHGSLLAQTMLTVQGPLSNLIFDSLARLGTALSLKVARDPTASRALQAALTSPHASVIFRRKEIQQFYGHVGEMALDPAASHVIDAIWEGTVGLAFIRERIAEELAENEAALRESYVGRAVWRNWKMDLYKRRRGDWVKQAKSAGNDGFQAFPEASAEDRPKKKSAIELAREKHAKAKKEKEKREAKSKGKEVAKAEDEMEE